MRKLLFLFAFAFGVARIASSQTTPYTAIDYPGAATTVAWGINNRGDVVGVYVLPNNTRHGFLWRAGKLTPIDYPGAANTEAFGINIHGEIVGDYYDVSGLTRGFVLTQGRYVDLGFRGAAAMGPAGINSSRAIIAGYNVEANDGLGHAAVIQDDVVRRYDYPGATSTSGNGINDAGDWVGNCIISGVTRGFVFRSGKTETIEYPGASFTGAYGISLAGDIVGRYRDAAGATHGFLYSYSAAKYTSIDLPGATLTAVDAMNDAGDLVGRYTVSGVTHAFVMTSPTLRYSITDLGTLPGGSFSQASQGNTENGIIAGVSDVAGGDQHAVLWQFGQPSDLAVRGLGGPNSIAIGLNAHGTAVGQAETFEADTEDFCLYGTGYRCAPFIWQNGLMSQLPTLGGPNGAVSAINNSGWAAGLAQTPTRDSKCPAPLVHQFEAVMWGPRGQMRALPPLPGDSVAVALWMNDRGQVVGTSGSCDNTLPAGIIVGPHAVLWDSNGTPTDLGSLGGSVDVSLPAVGNRALYVNNVGQVVGASALAGNQTAHAFVWTQESGIKDIGVLPGDDNSEANAVNERGEIVGVSHKGRNLKAFIWRNGAMDDLNSLSMDSPLHLLFANGINNRGEIVGFGVTASGDVHAFLATPVFSSTGNTRLEMPAAVFSLAARRMLQRFAARPGR